MIVIMPMTRMIKKTTAACMALLAMGTAAQAQVPGSALNYMLQKPRVTKYYKDKHFMDHLFVDGGRKLVLAQKLFEMECLRVFTS